jgi:hypothetical protein
MPWKKKPLEIYQTERGECIYLADNTRSKRGSKRGRYPFLFISKEIRGNK